MQNGRSGNAEDELGMPVRGREATAAALADIPESLMNLLSLAG
ncbi:hypothetical protein [Lactiplantibacillus plajomi]|uniref:Uncharacterized protein n=1 Tax=Lactiplantibacillus plajomi TaxID=1457217 RepID=A0ABV6K1F0_9LACO|nr:hypothetical protein [Lactiplantibacillus plajomi]